MVKLLIVLTVLTLVCSVSATAAEAEAQPITHQAIPILQSYPGSSADTVLPFLGYDSELRDLIMAVPGILSITPGDNWANFVAAAQQGIPYSLKNVLLTKRTPQLVQCANVFPSRVINQQGTPNIRLWWPLMYEAPGTTWTLTVLYGTYSAWDDDGPGPNPATYVHTDVWTWQVTATLESMQNLLALFHELPFGTDEVPLISDELLYPVLQAKLSALAEAVRIGDMVTAGNILADFEMEVADACITSSPMYPSPSGNGTGIAQTDENPACCKLMADAEYVGRSLGIWQQRK